MAKTVDQLIDQARRQIVRIAEDMRREFVTNNLAAGLDPDHLDVILASHDQRFAEWRESALAKVRADLMGSG
jgi:hypothetical protein